MNSVSYIDTVEQWQARVLKWTMGLSLLFHACMIVLGPPLSALFPQVTIPPVVVVELSAAPMSTLPDDEPPPPSPAPVLRETVASPSRKPAPSPPAVARPSRAEQWLKKLDAGLVKVPEAPISRKTGKPGGIPVRNWETGAAPRPGDFPPAVAPDIKAFRGQISDLEGKIRAGGVPGVGVGGEVEVSAMFGGTGTAGGDPIPPWIRDMIRRRVREHLPELEALYSAAFRRDPAIRGKLLVRFRIDPSGRVVRAEHGGSPLHDDTFVESVLTKIRGWTFDATDGRTVEVLYPFVFIAPS